MDRGVYRFPRRGCDDPLSTAPGARFLPNPSLQGAQGGVRGSSMISYSLFMGLQQSDC